MGDEEMTDRDPMMLDAKYHLREAYDRMNVAYYTSHLNESSAETHYKEAIDHLAKANAYIATYNNPHPTVNPHHSGYLADDETRATECPHCGNENDYDCEKKCPMCHLWDLDDDDVKLRRLNELAKELNSEKLNQLFSYLVTEVWS